MSITASFLFFSSAAVWAEPPQTEPVGETPTENSIATLPGAAMATAGSFTFWAAPLALVASAIVDDATQSSYLSPAAFLIGPTGISLSHFGNKRMLKAMDGKVNDTAFKWGSRLSITSAVVGGAGIGFGIAGYIMSADDDPDPASVINLPDGFGMYIMGALCLYGSIATMASASIAYDVQRRRTLRAQQDFNFSSDHFDSNKNHFSIGFSPSINGASVVGTF